MVYICLALLWDHSSMGCSSLTRLSELHILLLSCSHVPGENKSAQKNDSKRTMYVSTLEVEESALLSSSSSKIFLFQEEGLK